MSNHTKYYRKYETVIIVHPDASDEDNEKVLARVEAVFTAKDGHEIRREFWGKRRLAYEIRKVRKGVYHYFVYLAPADLVLELERNLGILDQVIRYMTVQLEDQVALEGFDFESARAESSAIARQAAGGEGEGEGEGGGEGDAPRNARSTGRGPDRDDDEEEEEDDE